MSTTAAETKQNNEVFRFAHPFFTTVPPEDRNATGGAKRMTDYIANNLQPLPHYGEKDLKMSLKDIVGKKAAKEMEAAGVIRFHLGGDTGAPVHGMQQPIADTMSEDYNINKELECPAFFLHLGDVIYYENTTEGYHKQFYEPYKKYPGKIIAIPGNHDGEMFKYNESKQPSTGQKFSLAAFIDNFCREQPEVPPAANTIYRQMVAQPGVYWWLQSELIDIVGLYSNVSEGPGYIVTTNDSSQKHWLLKTLKSIAAERNHKQSKHKPLLIAVHHPPYSAAGHESSTGMLNDIDECCLAAQILPDAFVSGHAHNYQHFERSVKCNKKKIRVPYFIVGDSGHNADPVVAGKPSTKPIPANVKVGKSLDGNGYMVAHLTKEKLNFHFYQVTVDDQNKITRKLYDTSSISLKGSNTGKIELM